MNVIEQLLKIDAGKITLETKKVKINKASKLLGEDIYFTCNSIGFDIYSEIQKDAIKMDKKGNITGCDMSSVQLKLILEGCPEIKDKSLLQHFNVVTPFELMKKIFNIGDINNLSNAISEVSGIDEDVDKEIKN